MSIIFHESSKTFHLYNNNISYIMTVLPNGHLGNLYFGKRIHDREDFSYLLEMKQRPMTACVYEGNRKFSLEHLKLEYPVYGSSDYRYPAVEILQENGSRISDFTYVSYTIAAGKPKLQGLPATYTEKDEEAQTLCVKLKDEVTGIVLELLYTIFTQRGIITRSARFTNEGTSSVHLLNAMSLSLDLPDKDYVWMQFSGAWSRERHVKERRLEQGIQSVGSIRGNSSHEHNPFIVLRRPSATENAGEVMGFSLIYSGNHRMQAEVDTHDTTRITAGINPQNFDWKLDCGESFQTPEAVVVFSDKGLNGMSQTFHKLYQKRLARGYWRDRPRPILNNNWEATYFDFTEDRLVEIIRAAINVKKAHPDWNVKPEIMIPLVGDIKELKYVKKFVVETADAEIAAANSDLEYEVGTMIEIPRAALTADQIASEADFFCFGTNDLTQMTYGFSRDDAGKFLEAYYDAKIFENDPFAKLDQTGVGKLMKMAIELGKPVNPSLHVGICGEHGGDPSSVEFCNKIGLDYVSCSPFRVPIARLAAAQAAINQK